MATKSFETIMKELKSQLWHARQKTHGSSVSQSLKESILEQSQTLLDLVDAGELDDRQAEQAQAKADECILVAELITARQRESGTGGRSRHRRPSPMQTAGFDDGFGDSFGQQTNAAKPAEEMYRNARTGERVAVLSNQESFRDYLAASGDFEDSPLAQLDEPMPSVGECIVGLITGEQRPAVRAALSTGSMTNGGYLVDETLSSEVIDLARSDSVMFRAGARTVPMNTSELIMARVTSDPTISWVAENSTIPTTSTAFGRLRFRARKMGCIIPISVELTRDAPNAAAEIDRLLRRAMADELDRVILLGDADGEEPVGIFNHPDVTENDISAAVDWDDFLDSYQSVLDGDGMPGAIIYPPAVKVALAKLKRNSEANNYAAMPEVLGELQRLVSTRLANDQAALGDFSQVMIGVRSGVELLATNLVETASGDGFSKDQVLIKVRWRGDVQLAHGDHIEKLTNIS